MNWVPFIFGAVSGVLFTSAAVILSIAVDGWLAQRHEAAARRLFDGNRRP